MRYSIYRLKIRKYALCIDGSNMSNFTQKSMGYGLKVIYSGVQILHFIKQFKKYSFCSFMAPKRGFKGISHEFTRVLCKERLVGKTLCSFMLTQSNEDFDKGNVFAFNQLCVYQELRTASFMVAYTTYLVTYRPDRSRQSSI